MIVSTAARRFALFAFGMTVLVAGARLATDHFISVAHAAGAFAMGQCAAYGQAYDYPSEPSAKAAALKQCKGDCTAVILKKACAAFAVDLTNPCGPHGYAVRPKISTSLNDATRECYKYGGNECVIRAWVCDGKG